MGKELDSFVLSNGICIPAVGLGATGIWEEESKPRSALYNAAYEIYAYSLENEKCFLYDTSQSYGLNELALGEAIRDTNKRNGIKIMTKVGNEAQRMNSVWKALEDSLKHLHTDYIDVYLIHWPQTGTFINTWLEMEKMYEEGIVKAIGVCNCEIHHLKEIEQMTNIRPMINEFEVHPLFTQDTLVNYCFSKDIQVVAYSPLARMHDVLFRSEPVRALSEKYGVTKTQLILRWHNQLGRVSIPRTLNKKHLDEIADIGKFELTPKEVASINALNDNVRIRYNPDLCDYFAL